MAADGPEHKQAPEVTAAAPEPEQTIETGRTRAAWIWAPYSVVAWSGAFAVMLFATFGAVILNIFAPFERTQYYWAQPMLRSCMFLMLSPVKRTIHRNHDRTRASVYVHNHTSMLDAHVACRGIPTVFCGLENANHLLVPGYGWLLRMGNAIGVPSSRDGGRFKIIADAFKNRASRNISILTFPEGHRTKNGKIRPFRRGVFFAARDAGIPVVPIGARGMHRLLPKGTWIMKPSRIHTRVGPQIETAGLTDDQVEDLTQTVRRILIGWVEHGEDVTDHEIEQFEKRCGRA